MKQKNILKLTATAFAMIGAGMILFNAAAEVTLAANNGKVEAIPTSYQVPSGNQVLTVRKQHCQSLKPGRKAVEK